VQVTEQHGVAESGPENRPQPGDCSHGETGLELLVEEDSDVGGGEVDERERSERGHEVPVDGPRVVVEGSLRRDRSG
jgi:hypothetical protein